MSAQYYRMNFVVRDYYKEKEKEICTTLGEMWGGHNTSMSTEKNVIQACGENYLGKDDSDDDFAARVRNAVWEANGKPCYIAITSTCLDDLPYDIYEYDPNDPDIINEWKERIKSDEPE